MRRDEQTDGHESRSCFSWFCESAQSVTVSIYCNSFFGFSSRDAACLLRGTDWTFEYNSGYFLYVQVNCNNVVDIEMPVM
jgi:hypothetical protein